MLVFDTETQTYIEEPDHIYEILNYKNPFLRKTVNPFSFEEHDAKTLKKNFIATIQKYPAFGLSAPQVGIDARFFVMMHDNEYICIINPEILGTSEIVLKDKEGCLSDMYMMAVVPRPKWIKVKFQDENSAEHILTFDDMSARIFLHEYDHLNGKLFTDLLGPVALKMARDKQTKFIKKAKKLNLI